MSTRGRRLRVYGDRSRTQVTGRRGTRACIGYRLVQHRDRVADMVQQGRQIPAGAGGGVWQERRGDQRGTGERVADPRFEQLQAPAQGSHGGTVGSRTATGPVVAARYCAGRPNTGNRPGLTKLTIRVMPVVVAVA